MSASIQPPLNSSSDSTFNATREERKQRARRIVRKGLPPFPQTALELTKILGGTSPDLKRAGKLICADPTLSSQVLRLCNSPMFGLRSRVISIEQAAMLLGAERLRNLAVTSSVVDFTSKALPESQISAFWQHSFLAAMLAQFLARRYEYFEKDQAYIAGLLHDIGQIPLWMLLIEDAAKSKQALPASRANWMDNTRAEQEYFGIDHCELGSTMAGFWDFLPSFVDVLGNHHTPELAKHDKTLVRIVGVVEFFLPAHEQTHNPADEPAKNEPEATTSPEEDARFREKAQTLTRLGQGLFGEIEWNYIEEALTIEYMRLQPLVQAGLRGVLARSDEE